MSTDGHRRRRGPCILSGKAASRRPPPGLVAYPDEGIEFALAYRIDDRAYLFGFHWKESLWSANLRRLNLQTKPRVG